MDNSDHFRRDSRNAVFDSYELLGYFIMVLGLPIVAVFGTFGNVMAILITLRLPSSTSSVFFIVLAVSDQVFLMAALQYLLRMMFDFTHVEYQGDWQCQIFRFLMRVAPSVSSWMLVSLTMLRAASVLWPLRVGAVWTKRKSRATTGAVSVALMAINFHRFLGFHIDYDTGVCYLRATGMYAWFARRLEPWINLLQFSFFPFVMLLISNSVLVRTLVGSVRTISKHLSTSQQQQASQDSREQKVSSLTVTLTAANVSFFLLTTPWAVYLILAIYVDWTDPVHMGQVEVFFYTSTLLNMWNSGINFYLYCLTGTKFRAELVKLAADFRGIFRKTKKVNSGAH